MSVRIRKNALPKVISGLVSEVDRAVDETAREIERIADARAPKLTGLLVRSTRPEEAGSLHATVTAGGAAYYAGYQEFGTSKMAANPFMVPAAQAGEPILVQRTTDAVRRACDV